MYYVVYVSSAVRPFTAQELAELMARACANNSRLGITGLLLYKEGNFMQMLEGDEEAVRSVHHKILRDPRHHMVITIAKGNQQERQFPNWAMAFRDLRTPDLENTPGYSDFLNAPFTGEEFAANPTRAQKLLLSFKQRM